MSTDLDTKGRKIVQMFPEGPFRWFTPDTIKFDVNEARGGLLIMAK